MTKTLPTLNQDDFPSLPQIPEDCTVLEPYGTGLQNYEMEVVLGILITAAIRAGTWCVIPIETFNSLLDAGYGNNRFTREIRSTTIPDMCRRGLVNMIEVNGEQCIVPIPNIARMARNFTRTPSKKVAT